MSPAGSRTFMLQTRSDGRWNEIFQSALLSPKAKLSYSPGLLTALRQLEYVAGLLGRNLGLLRRVIWGSLHSLVTWLLSPIKLRSRAVSAFEAQFFILRKWHGALAAVLLGRGLGSLLLLAKSQSKLAHIRELERRMIEATTYEAWCEAAIELDDLQGRAPTPHRLSDGLRGLQARTSTMRTMREGGDVHGLMWVLRQDGSRSVGALLGAAVEEGRVRCLVPPPAVNEYLAEAQASLHYVCHCQDLSLEERLAFVRELRHSYGRTGLVLSGGGSFGHFHFGVSRALLGAGLLPRVLSGSSAGSIGCAMLCTRTDAELAATMDGWVDCADTDFYGATKGVRGMMRHLVTRGTVHAAEDFVVRLRRLLGDLTFQEAYARSGRVLNIAVVAADTREPCRLLNYLTASNVLVWSAVACSSAFPYLFAPQELLVKDVQGRILPLTPADMTGTGVMRRWCDGSLEEDLPMRGLGEMFNVNYFLASQANPWLVPVLAFQQSLPTKVQRLGEWELKHRVGQLLYLWPNNKLFKLICQPWRGDINFRLPLSAFPILRSAVNFTPQEIFKAMNEGQRAVWAKLPAVRAACAVEVAIDGELRALALQARAAVRREEQTIALSSRYQSSLPSWLDLRSLGLVSAADDSTEDMQALLAGSSDGSPKMPVKRSSLDPIHEVPPELDTLVGAQFDVGLASPRNPKASSSVAGPSTPVVGAAHPGLMTYTNGYGSTPARLEGGMEALKDITALVMGAEGLDLVAP